MTDTPSSVGLVSEHACTLTTSGWQIPAALTLPTRTSDEQLASAIFLIPGSLYSDVNGDYPVWHSRPHVYGHLARQLSVRGHAVYRFAKLGPGTGSVAVDAEASEAVKGWDGRLAIATAALDAMRAELETRTVRVARTIAAGHSEGAVVLSRLATSDRASVLDGVVLLAGPSVGILDIMREQTASSTPPDQREEAMRRLDSAIDHMRRGAPIPAELADGGRMGAAALASMPPEAQRYMRECDATDPLALASQMSQPVLVLQGGNDTSVPTHHGEALHAALRARASGRSDYLFLPGLTHMYKRVPADVPPMEAFGYPGETDVAVADGVDEWIRGLA